MKIFGGSMKRSIIYVVIVAMFNATLPWPVLAAGITEGSSLMQRSLDMTNRFGKWWFTSGGVEESLKWWGKPGNLREGVRELLSISTRQALNSREDYVQQIRELKGALHKTALTKAELNQMVAAAKNAKAANVLVSSLLSKSILEKLSLQKDILARLQDLQRSSDDLMVQGLVVDALKVAALASGLTYVTGLVASGALAATEASSLVWTAETGAATAGSTTSSGISAWTIIFNIIYAVRRAKGAQDWQVLFFIFGFPFTIISWAFIDEGSHSIFGIQVQ